MSKNTVCNGIAAWQQNVHVFLLLNRTIGDGTNHNLCVKRYAAKVKRPYMQYAGLK